MEITPCATRSPKASRIAGRLAPQSPSQASMTPLCSRRGAEPPHGESPHGPSFSFPDFAGAGQFFGSRLLLAIGCRPSSTTARTPATEFKVSLPKRFQTIRPIVGRLHPCVGKRTL